MSKEKTILKEGLVTGIFSGIAITTGIRADPGSVYTSALTAIDKVASPLASSGYNIHFFLQFIIVCIAITGFCGFLYTIHSCGNIVKGFVIFTGGFLSMVCLILLLFSLL